jgi:HlyD family secretion protein
MFKIADLETLMVSTKVDEVDVNQLREGQSVEITGEAFSVSPLRGEVARISTQALSSAVSSSKAAVFEVLVKLKELTAEQRKAIRMGMSAQIFIVRYQNSNAIVVPPIVIHQEAGHPIVWKRDPNKKDISKESIVLGRTTSSGVEILKGVADGDQLFFNQTW